MVFPGEPRLQLDSSRAFLTGPEQVCPLNCLEDSRHRFDKNVNSFAFRINTFLLDKADAFFVGYFASVLAFNFDCFSELVPRICKVYL